MADPGIATPPPADPEGLATMKQYAAGPGGPGAAMQYKAQTSADLSRAGWGQGQINEYFGDNLITNRDLTDQVQRGVQRNLPQVTTKIAGDPWEAFRAGWQISDGGLIKNRALPTIGLGPNPGFLNSAAAAVGQFVGDAPFSIGGAAAGGTAGAMIPGADLTGIPEVAGAGAGAAATPTALRHALIIGIKNGNGQYKSSADLLKDAWGATIETMKQGAIGAITGPFGKFTGGLTGSALGEAAASQGGKLLVGATDVATQVTTATTANAAMEGHLPTAQDFAAGAVTALGGVGLHIVAGKVSPTEKADRVASNLQGIYAETGTPPWKAADMARNSPKLQEEILTQDVHGDPVAPGYKAAGPEEPPRYGDPPIGSPQAQQKRYLLATSGVDRMGELTKALEGSGVNAVSDKGARGTYQIMPGTARQYGFDPADAFDPVKAKMMNRVIMTDLLKRANGDETAALVGYNAGPGWMARVINAPEGTRLEAEHDTSAPNGIRYDRVPAARDEAFLPLETQKYLANARRRAGADLQGGATAPTKAPVGLDTLAKAEGVTEAPTKLQGAPDWEVERQKALDDAEKTRLDEADKQQAEWDKSAEEAKTAGAEPPKPMGDEDDWTKVIRSQIADPRPPAKLVDADTMYNQYVNRMGPFKAIDEHLSTEFGYNKKSDLGVADIFNYARTSEGRAAAMLKWGAFDANGKPIGGPTLDGAVKQVKDAGGKTMQDWEAYILARRATNLAQDRGIDAKIKLPEAAALASSPKAQAQFEGGTQEFTDVMNKVILPYAASKGLYSPEQVNAMVEGNPVYISMAKAIENPVSKGAARGFSPTQVSAMKGGSDLKLQASPLEATLWNATRIVASADRNQAIGFLVKLAEDGVLPDELGMQKVGEEPAKPGADALGDADHDTENWKVQPTQFKFFRNGVAETWQVKDPDVAGLIRGISNKTEADLLNTMMSFAAKTARSGIAGMVDFPLRVVGFHQLQNFVTSPNHPLPYVTWVRGAMDALTTSDKFKTAQFNGAFGAAMSDLDVNTLNDNLGKVFEETGVTKTMFNLVPDAIHLSSLFHSRIDAAARIGNIQVLENAGLSPVKAAMRTRNELLDFTQQGTNDFVNTWARWTPFLKGKILGTENWINAFKERPFETSLFATAGLVAPAVALGIASALQDPLLPEERRLQQYDPRLRDTHFITPEIAGQRALIPLPPILGNLIVGPVWRTIDKMQGEDPEGFKAWGERMLADMTDVVPPAIRPMIEQATNHSFFTQKALVPSEMVAASPKKQYVASTSMVARKLSSILGDNANIPVSPIVFDNYVQSWTGTIGTSVLHALDVPLGKDPGPPETLTQNPFVKSFLALHPGQNAYSINRFYEAEQALQEKDADYKLDTKRKYVQGSPSADAPTGAEAVGSQEYSAISGIKQMLDVQRNAINGVWRNKDMSPEEKQQRVDGLVRQMIHSADMGSKMIHNFTTPHAPAPEEPADGTPDQ